MLNKVMLIGRLGRDPETRYSSSGTPVTNFSVATDESYVDRDGNKIDRTEWHKVVVYQRQAEICANYLHKGSLVYVEGSLQTRKWQDQQGQDRYTTEIKAQRVQFLDRKGDSPRPQGESAENSPQRYGNKKPGADKNGGVKEQHPEDEDMGPAFPSEASTLDKVPF